MVYTIWFIRPTQTQLCLPKPPALIPVLCKSKGRMWAQWEIHVGPLTRAGLSVHNWACKRCCSGLHLPRPAKPLLTAAASSCQLSSQTDQLPKSIFIISSPCPASFLEIRKSSQSYRVYFNNCSYEHATDRKEFLLAVETHIQCLEVVPTFHYLGTGCETTLNSLCGIPSLKRSCIPWKSLTSPVPRGSQAGMFLSFPVYLLRLKSLLAAVWEWE